MDAILLMLLTTLVKFCNACSCISTDIHLERKVALLEKWESCIGIPFSLFWFSCVLLYINICGIILCLILLYDLQVNSL